MSLVNHEKQREIAWRVELNLQVSGIDHPTLQWSVFVEDPFTQFTKELTKQKLIYHHLSNSSEDRIWKRNIHLSHLISCWNSNFRYIRGDEVYLMTEGTNVTPLFSPINQLDKLWIATKAITMFEEPVCWCLLVNVKPGVLNELNLNNDNVILLMNFSDG